MPKIHRWEKCLTDGCDGWTRTKGLCSSCYNRQRRVDLNGRPCCVKGCDRTQFARKLCTKHYREWKRGVEAEVKFSTPHPRLAELDRYAKARGKSRTAIINKLLKDLLGT